MYCIHSDLFLDGSAYEWLVVNGKEILGTVTNKATHFTFLLAPLLQ